MEWQGAGVGGDGAGELRAAASLQSSWVQVAPRYRKVYLLVAVDAAGTLDVAQSGYRLL